MWELGASRQLLAGDCDRYDLVLVPDERTAARLRGRIDSRLEVLQSPARPEPALAVAKESQAPARADDAAAVRRLVELVLAEMDAQAFPMRIRA